MVRSDPQRRVEVAQRVGVVGFAARAVAAGDRDEVVLAPAALLALPFSLEDDPVESVLDDLLSK
jgi:hypothetical protein